MPQTAIYNMPLNIYKTNIETKIVVKQELKEKNPVETHKGGLGQDDPENKQKVEEAYGAAAKILDSSNQDEPYFEELDVAEMEELQ